MRYAEQFRRETGEEFIAYAARVSNPANQDNKETSSKLLRYLIREAHWSPFEMVHVVMQIIFILKPD